MEVDLQGVRAPLRLDEDYAEALLGEEVLDDLSKELKNQLKIN